MSKPTEISLLRDILEILKQTEPPAGLPMNIAQTTISIATPVKPVDANVVADAAVGQPGYDIISVYNSLKRRGNVYVINDGPGTLFFLATPDGKNWTGESEILKNEFRLVTQAWEIHIRSDDGATKYRATEYMPGFLA